MEQINVLISLHRGYGLGDAVQMSDVLRHVAKYRPNWVVDFQAEEGRHCVGHGIVANTFEFGKNPNPDKHYDAEVEMLLFDTWYNWHDRPNTRVSSCLHERFGLEWDRDCSKYQVNVREEVVVRVQQCWSSFVPHLQHRDKRVVGVHYKGDSSQAQKDLTNEEADIICYHILKLGCMPLVFDWRSTLPTTNRSWCGTTGRTEMSRKWGRDAEYNCAVIRECAAFVGIDSGPAKCASATDVPSLVVWTGHHPAAYHDPAYNTTHLVPYGYHDLKPVCGDRGVIDWFEANYNIRQYSSDPVSEIKTWLEETLR